MKRDLYIDFVKGIASINIIFIHTIFWSAFSYVPDFVREISLLIDVSLFFFLSGLTSSVSGDRSVKRLIKLQVTYMLFISFVYVAQIIFTSELNLRILFLWYIHDYSLPTYSLSELVGGMWYMKIYFLVLFIGILLLKLSSPKLYPWYGLISFVFIIIFSYLYRYSLGAIVYVNFYFFIFLIGYLSKQINLSKCWFIILMTFLLLLAGILRFYFGIALNNDQKFAPTIVYLFYSTISFVLVLGLRGKLKIVKNNFFTYVGQNAIYYYFAQGVSSSLIYILNVYLPVLNWYILLPIAFATNLLLAILIAEVIKKIDKSFWKLLYYLKSLLIKEV